MADTLTSLHFVKGFLNNQRSAALVLFRKASQCFKQCNLKVTTGGQSGQSACLVLSFAAARCLHPVSSRCLCLLQSHQNSIEKGAESLFDHIHLRRSHPMKHIRKHWTCVRRCAWMQGQTGYACNNGTCCCLVVLQWLFQQLLNPPC